MYGRSDMSSFKQIVIYFLISKLPMIYHSPIIVPCFNQIFNRYFGNEISKSWYNKISCDKDGIGTSPQFLSYNSTNEFTYFSIFTYTFPISLRDRSKIALWSTCWTWLL